MIKNYIKSARSIREKLHKLPEPSMKEINTKAALLEFLRKETKLEIIDKGNWFYAALRRPENASKTIAFRADYDAVTGEDGVSRHLCGHDGHAAILAAFGKWISDNKDSIDCNVILIFQPGEESGEGAVICRKIFELEKIDEIYGCHNIPGEKEGTVLIKHGTFACASTGLEITFKGAPAHAAYPETGVNPAEAFAGLILKIQEKLKEKTRGIVLSTVIGLSLGSDKYGVSASEGTLRLTVRGELAEEFEKMLSFIKDEALELALNFGLKCEIKEHDAFPSTENHESKLAKLMEAARMAGIEQKELSSPFRWSEDFGWYLKEREGAFFGIGAGEKCPALHTANYEFNDGIIKHVLNIYISLLKC